MTTTRWRRRRRRPGQASHESLRLRASLKLEPRWAAVWVSDGTKFIQNMRMQAREEIEVQNRAQQEAFLKLEIIAPLKVYGWDAEVFVLSETFQSKKFFTYYYHCYLCSTQYNDIKCWGRKKYKYRTTIVSFKFQGRLWFQNAIQCKYGTRERADILLVRCTMMIQFI